MDAHWDLGILSRIDGTICARDLLALVPMASADAARSLFGLLCTGLVDYRAAGPALP